MRSGVFSGRLGSEDGEKRDGDRRPEISIEPAKRCGQAIRQDGPAEGGRRQEVLGKQRQQRGPLGCRERHHEPRAGRVLARVRGGVTGKGVPRVLDVGGCVGSRLGGAGRSVIANARAKCGGDHAH